MKKIFLCLILLLIPIRLYADAGDWKVIDGIAQAHKYKIYDSNRSDWLTISLGSNLTAPRNLVLYTGDASRALTLTGDPSIGSLTLTTLPVGFTIAGGTTSKTLTVDETVVISALQPLDATLTSIALLGTTQDKMLYTTDVNTWAEASITIAGRAILDDASASAQATTLGLGTGNSPTFVMVKLTDQFRLGELAINGTEYVWQRSPDSVATSWGMIWPTAKGSANQVPYIVSVSGEEVTLGWIAAAVSLTNPMDTAGDLIYGGASPAGTPTALHTATHTAGQVLTLTDVGGILYPQWGPGGGAGTPAGSDQDVQINVSGAFGVDTGIFKYDSTNKTLSVLGIKTGAKISLATHNTSTGNASSNEIRIGTETAGADHFRIVVYTAEHATKPSFVEIINKAANAPIKFGVHDINQMTLWSGGTLDLGVMGTNSGTIRLMSSGSNQYMTLGADDAGHLQIFNYIFGNPIGGATIDLFGTATKYARLSANTVGGLSISTGYGGGTAGILLNDPTSIGGPLSFISGSYTSKFQVGTQSINIIYTLPTVQASGTKWLKNTVADGIGVWSWDTPGYTTEPTFTKVGIGVAPTYQLDIQDGQMRSLYTGDHNFTVDSTGFLCGSTCYDSWPWTDFTHRAANLIKVQSAQTYTTNSGCLGSGNPWACCTGAGTGTCESKTMENGFSISAQTNDVGDYTACLEAGTCHHAFNALAVDVYGKDSISPQDRDITAIQIKVQANTTLNGINSGTRNVGGILMDISQYGDGGTTGFEIGIANPASAVLQAHSMFGSQINMFPNKGPADNSAYYYIGLDITNRGLYKMSSAIRVGGAQPTGNWMDGIDMSGAYIAGGVGIKMPQSVIGSHVGTKISYDPDEYSFYDRSDNYFGWAIGLVAEMAPTLEAANWTTTDGWSAGAGQLVKVAGTGTGTATPSGTFTITTSSTYKVTIICSAVSGTLTYTIGGVQGTTITTTTIVDYIKASTAGKIIFSGEAAVTATITFLSVQKVQQVGRLDSTGAFYLERTGTNDATIVALTGAANEKVTFGWANDGYGYIQGGTSGGTLKTVRLQPFGGVLYLGNGWSINDTYVNGSLVSYGDADSCGSGYRCLRIPN